MKIKHLLTAGLLSLSMVGTASAALLTTVDGPDNSNDIDFTFEYLSQPGTGPTLTQLVLNATGLGITFDNDAGWSESSSGFSLVSATGWDTAILTMTFSNWNDGESLQLSNIDLDPNSSDEVQDLIGLLISATYSSGVVESYRLIDDTGRQDRNGLISQAVQTPTPVPEPATLGLLGLGLAGVGLAVRRRRS